MSTLSLRKIKHDSSSVDNIVTNSDGGVGVGGIDPSTLPSFVHHAIKVQNGGGLGIQSDNATDNRWIFFGNGTANADVQRAGIVNQGSDQSLGLATAGTQRLIVDAVGRVTTPYQVAFAAFYNGVTFNNAPVYDTASFNIGNAYNTSNGTFTAPVAGMYHFAGWYRFNQTGATYCQFGLKRNGSSTGWNGAYVNSTFENSTYSSPIIAITYYLNAGDYVTAYAIASGGSPSVSGSESWFSGYLLG